MLVGPSGCGKTTVLRMVAGLEDLTEGSIRIGGRVVNEVPPGDRDVAMVFQNYALYPHMTVYQNIGLSLKIRKVKRDELTRRVQEAAELLQLEELLTKRPRELSGGQRQRVAMGRAIVREPQAFLMDEPLSNLDAKLRVQMRAEIVRHPEGPPCDDRLRHARPDGGDDPRRPCRGDEARACSSRWPRRRTSTRVRSTCSWPAFIGSPAMNLVEASLSQQRATARSSSSPAVGSGPRRGRVGPPGLAGFRGRTVILGIRPRNMDDAALVSSPDPDSRFPVVVDLAEGMGSDVYLHYTIEAPPVVHRGHAGSSPRTSTRRPSPT